MNRSAATIVGAGWQVLHVVGGKSDLGPSDLDGYHVLPYCDRMDLAYAASDFVVSRSGAGMVCELTAVGLPSVLCRTLWATASSATTRRTSSTPGEPCSSRTRNSTRTG